MTAEIRRTWEGMACIGYIMTNLDHSIEPGLEELLRSKLVWGGYAAWDFYGHVWWDGAQFCCDVWQYRQSIGILVAKSLRELMHLCCDRFGRD